MGSAATIHTPCVLLHSTISSLLIASVCINTVAAKIVADARLHQIRDEPRSGQPGPNGINRVAPLNTFISIKDEFDRRRDQIENFVFQSLNSFSLNNEENSINGETSPSRIFTYNDFFSSLRELAVGGIYGKSYHVDTNPYVTSPNPSEEGFNTPSDSYVGDPSNMAFYMSQSDPMEENSMLYAIVNICAFLANAMVESIQYDSCEELNGMSTVGNPSRNNQVVLSELYAVNGRYFPMSNACGQFGKLYNERDGCFVVNSTNNSEVDMSCDVDTTLEIEAAAHPIYNYQPGEDDATFTRNRPPPPFYCGPKSEPNPYSGYWDGYSAEFIRNVAYPSALGKIDVEGCCYWGRGALSTKNVCNFGKINYYMGNRAYREGRPSRYPAIDFCLTPWIICDTTRVMGSGLDYPELKWIVAIFEWIERVQSYDNGTSNWAYMTQLKQFVDNGAKDLTFIDTVSSVLTRGCDESFCSTQPTYRADQRRRNFEVLIDIFDIHGMLGVPSTSRPSRLQPSYDYEYAEKWLQSKRSKIEGNIFISQNTAMNGLPHFSTAYRFNSFISALRTSAYFGVAEKRFFFLSNADEGLRGFNAGLVNLAAFLANAMVESITFDSCDEVNWDSDSSGKYAISNSCGQNGRDYSLESCPLWQSFMACNANPEMRIQAETPSTQEDLFLAGNSPPPFQCQPGDSIAGYYHPNEGLVDSTEHSNSAGHVTVESCCWWGRGALSTKGTCNMGKLNFHMGARAATDGRPSLYPNINFCSDPEAICTHKNSMEIRWVVAMFEWIDRVQSYYNSTMEWEYMTSLYQYVDGGMEDNSFLEAVNSIVARGCHLYPCSSALSIKSDRYLYGFERTQNILNILKIVFELPVTESNDLVSTDSSPFALGPGISNPFADLNSLKQLFPSAKPTVSPTESSNAPTVSHMKIPSSTDTTPPTSSPVEFSNITMYKDGLTHVIDKNSISFGDESVVAMNKTKLILKGGNVTAPIDTEWPAIRLSIGSSLNATDGVVRGSFVGENSVNSDGGEAIQLTNGQSSSETAGYGEFYTGIKVFGGDSSAANGVGGDALVVNGFGTQAFIYGGIFVGGSGAKANGYSIRVLNSATVNIHGGNFVGDMRSEVNGLIALHGCFVRNGTEVSGYFSDETELSVAVYGDVDFIPIEGQECDTAPSIAPTTTLVSQPPILAPNGIVGRLKSPMVLLPLAVSISLLQFFINQI